MCVSWCVWRAAVRCQKQKRCLRAAGSGEREIAQSTASNPVRSQERALHRFASASERTRHAHSRNARTEHTDTHAHRRNATPADPFCFAAASLSVLVWFLAARRSRVLCFLFVVLLCFSGWKSARTTKQRTNERTSGRQWGPKTEIVVARGIGVCCCSFLFR